VSRPVTSVLVFTGLTALLTSPAAAHPSEGRSVPSTCGPAWEIVASPNAGNSGSSLLAVSALSGADAWAAGNYNNVTTEPVIETKPLYLHWDGSAWTRFLDNSSSGSHTILDIVETAPADAWAVGRAESSGPQIPFAERWDGSAWSEVTLPTKGILPILSGIAASSPDDVWAVGFYQNESLTRNQTLIEHWDGVAWSIVPSPNIGTKGNTLSDVAVISASDAWAAGAVVDDIRQVSRPFFLHWDGLTWSVVKAWQPRSATYTTIRSLDASAGGAAFAPGLVTFPDGGMFAEGWTGTRWSPLSVVRPQPVNYLYGMGVSSSGEVWAVGSTSPNGNKSSTLIERSTGGPFALDSSPNVTGASNELFGADVSPDGDVWAVGDSTANGLPSETLVEHLCP
jgi:hypothetical protein